MIKQEWKNIFHHAWIIIVLIAIILIPSIYSTVFLGSMWDPYGNIQNIPVAIVNEDQAVTYNGQSLYIGQELVENLKENASMNFHFVNVQEAMSGLENGDYYMVVTIPSNFSYCATTLLADEPEKMVLNYTTNPGTNYIASKMDDSAIEKIKSEVSASVTKTYAQTLFEQVDILSGGLQDAVEGSKQLLGGVNQLSDGNQQISSHLKTLASSSLTFEDGVTTLTTGLEAYTDGVLEVHNGVYALKNGFSTLSQSSPALINGLSQLDQGTQALNEGVQSYTDGVSKLYSGSQTLVENNDTLNSGIDNLSTNVTELTNGQTQITIGLDDLSKAIDSNITSLQDYLNIYQQLNNQNPTLAQVLINQGLNQNTLDILKQQGTIDEPTYLMLVNIISQENLPSLEQLFKTMNSQMTTLSTSIDTLHTGSQTVNQGLETLQTSIDTRLVPGIHAYTQGAFDIHQGLETLNQTSTDLLSGSQALASGTTSLTNQIPTLQNGIQSLDLGINRLYEGTSQLISNNDTLVNGSQQLDQGALQISDGANQLALGSQDLSQGLNEVQNGVETLKTGLQDGADQTNMQTSDQTYDMMATPVTLNHEEISTVENNGHAMAPYMMSVALYVAGMAFVLMYPLRNGIKGAKNAFSFWLSKASVMYTVSTLSAILLVTALNLINGFHPQQMFMTYILAIVVAAAFMSIISLLSLTTGHIGDFILLVFMILNLGGSAGTYPLETSSTFYKIIHPFVPYTYSVNGFRKTISLATASVTTEIFIFIGIFVVCSILTILYFALKNKEDRHIIPQAFEENH